MSRIEHDLLGTLEIPEAALYGIHTARAVSNFQFSAKTLGEDRELSRAFADLKAAAAMANGDFGLLDPGSVQAIIAAADEMASGTLSADLIVELFEGSGGTSINMNVNEVLANRALQLMGSVAGAYDRLHPNDHVNRSQSTNDVVPSAIKIACYRLCNGLEKAIQSLELRFQEKRLEFARVMRLGRTCLQDAQPMTVGQSFGSYRALSARLREKLAAVRDDLLELPLGGTAIGTGFGSPSGYIGKVFEHLRDRTGEQWRPAGDRFDAMANSDAFARVSAELRTCAAALAKIAEDFIILSSGPDGGVGELQLAPLQAGSSIMPGKVNPVAPMALIQVAFAVAGNDAAIGMACARGPLEINMFEPLIAAKLPESIRLLTAAVALFGDRCVKQVAVDEERAMRHLLASSALATALAERSGYTIVSKLVNQARREGRSFTEVAENAGLLARGEAVALLNAASFPVK